MRIKNVYIYTRDYEKDFNFIRKDKKEYNIKDEDIYTDMNFEHAIETDIAHGLYGWDAVRITNGEKELFIVEVNNKIKIYERPKV